jgi:hypothetical protein
MNISKQIRQLQKLYWDGAISEEEFEAGKAALIEGLRSPGAEVSPGRAPRPVRTIIFFVTGLLLLLLFGMLLSIGITMDLVREQPKHELRVDIAGLIFFGILPAVLAIICFRKAFR